MASISCINRMGRNVGRFQVGRHVDRSQLRRHMDRSLGVPRVSWRVSTCLRCKDFLHRVVNIFISCCKDCYIVIFHVKSVGLTYGRARTSFWRSLSQFLVS